MAHVPTVVGLGEILWDLLPSGRQLGGAPANFAYCSHLLGNRAIVASRVGDDELGRELRNSLLRFGITDEFVQTDPVHRTGTVRVEINPEGQPKFEIMHPAAWDFLDWNESWETLAKSADAVCFGSLAQRSAASRGTIRKFLELTRPEALRIFDVNLRQTFYSAEIISSSLHRANILKLNHEELPVLASLLHINSSGEVAFCREVLDEFDLQLVCVTRGGNGSVLVDKSGAHEHAGFRVAVKDTVGAGDAFTAGLVHERLRGNSLAAMNDTANRMGAWVASHAGAMPPVPEGGEKSALDGLTRG
jgi:fructokinase